MAIVIAGAHSRRLIRAAGGAGAAVGKHSVCAGRGPAKRRKTTIDLPDSGRSKRTLPRTGEHDSLELRFRLRVPVTPRARRASATPRR